MSKKKWKLQTDTCPTCGYHRRDRYLHSPVATRFWKKVVKTESCWQWIGQKHKGGYGLFWISDHGKKELAHRVSWFLSTGQWPEKQVLHSCDNPACVRHEHHFLGTQNDNIADMIEKGRAAWQQKELS